MSIYNSLYRFIDDANKQIVDANKQIVDAIDIDELKGSLNASFDIGNVIGFFEELIHLNSYDSNKEQKSSRNTRSIAVTDPSNNRLTTTEIDTSDIISAADINITKPNEDKLLPTTVKKYFSEFVGAKGKINCNIKKFFLHITECDIEITDSFIIFSTGPVNKKITFDEIESKIENFDDFFSKFNVNIDTSFIQSNGKIKTIKDLYKDIKAISSKKSYSQADSFQSSEKLVDDVPQDHKEHIELLPQSLSSNEYSKSDTKKTSNSPTFSLSTIKNSVKKFATNIYSGTKKFLQLAYAPVAYALALPATLFSYTFGSNAQHWQKESNMSSFKDVVNDVVYGDDSHSLNSLNSYNKSNSDKESIYKTPLTTIKAPRLPYIQLNCSNHSVARIF